MRVKPKNRQKFRSPWHIFSSVCLVIGLVMYLHCWRAFKTDHLCALSFDQAFINVDFYTAVDKSTYLFGLLSRLVLHVKLVVNRRHSHFQDTVNMLTVLKLYLLGKFKMNKGLDCHLTPCFNWWPLCESNTVPTDYESAALTKHELRGQNLLVDYLLILTCFQEAS